MHELKSEVYTDRTFWDRFIEDLDQARYRVIIQSPFITHRRLDFLSHRFNKLINRGVTICTFIQEPSTWKKEENAEQNELEFKALMKSQNSLHLHPNTKAKIHEKLAIIDDSVLWEGSLNILSHANTRERMRRFTEKSEIENAINQHGLYDCEICVRAYQRYGGGTCQLLIDNLVKLRKNQKLSKFQLAQRCGFSRSWISRIEGESKNIMLKTFLEIASELQVEPVMVPKLLVPFFESVLTTTSLG